MMNWKSSAGIAVMWSCLSALSQGEVPESGKREFHPIPVVRADPGALDLVKVNVEGSASWFLIDTGANTNTLEPSVVEALGLKPGDDRNDVSGTGKVADVGSVVVDKIRIPGGVVIGKVKCHVLEAPAKEMELEGLEPGGILGSQTLHAIKARIDFGSYMLILPK
jgi:predicted aspartyl protease